MKKTCDKISHPDRETAKEHAHGLRVKGSTNPVGVYKCDQCKGWHVGTKKPRGKKLLTDTTGVKDVRNFKPKVKLNEGFVRIRES